MKMTHMPTIHAYQRYRNTKVYAYMVTSIHPEIPPSSKLDDWVNYSINTRYNQSHIPNGDNKDKCHIIKRVSIQARRFMPTSKHMSITQVH